jgi:hypothetical protein
MYLKEISMDENLVQTWNRIYIRPNTDVQFYEDPEEFTQYMITTYVETGKCLVFRKQTFLDDDKLKLQLESVWLNQRCYLEAENDPYLLENFFTVSNYCLSNGIQML